METITSTPNIITIKEENEDDLVDLEELFVFNKKGGVSTNMVVPKPSGLLHDMGPTPFLAKTYEMVENPQTNDVISWGENGFSFVVWDTYKFSINLLPKYFKHSNFSSFVRQLNTYGFKKVHFDRWEFANGAFQRGKKQLLKSIRRKYHGGNKINRFNFQRDTEIEQLKLEQETLKAEIYDLKQQQLHSEESLASLEERMKSVEWKQKELLLFIAQAMKKTPLFHRLLQGYGKRKALENGQVFKRRRLASSETLDDSSFQDLGQTPGVGPKDDTTTCIQSEENQFLGSSGVDVGPQTLHEQTSSLTSETSSSDLCSGNYIMWEKLMEDDVICEDDNEEGIDVDQTEFVHELEDLIGKPLATETVANDADSDGDDVGEIACTEGKFLASVLV